MNDTTAEAPQSSAPAETPGPESNSNGNSPPTNQAPGLLADAGGQDGTETPATETPGTPAAPEPGTIAKRPAYISEQFWDAEKGAVKGEDLANSYNVLRKEFNKLSQEKGGNAPEKAEDYLADYKPPHRSRAAEGQKDGDPLDRYGDLSANDPVFLAMAKFAKKGNMSPADFTDGMQDLMETLHPLLPEVFNPEKEKGLLGEGAEHMIKTNRDWIDTLARNGVVNEDEFNLLLGFGGTAIGVQLTNKLRLNSGEKPIPGKLNGGANKGRKTPDECNAMMADERYHAEGAAGDAYRAEVDKAFAETFGTDPA
ncbi:MAG: hypothetical protein KAV87_12965 [Desulfobacteraceae bacterium]|nr:hypothetical protein [Desulfobacteraceae bacterium]